MKHAIVAACLGATLTVAPAAAQAFVVDAALEADRERVRALQRQLNDLGMDTGAPDGAFGRRTEGAITAFAARFPLDAPPGLTPEVAARVTSAQEGRFGNPFELATLARPTGWTLTHEAGRRDVREANPDCGACNTTSWTLAVGDLTGDGDLDILVITNEGRENIIP